MKKRFHLRVIRPVEFKNVYFSSKRDALKYYYAEVYAHQKYNLIMLTDLKTLDILEIKSTSTK